MSKIRSGSLVALVLLVPLTGLAGAEEDQAKVRIEEPMEKAEYAAGTRITLRGTILEPKEKAHYYAFLVDIYDDGLYLQAPEICVKGENFEQSNICLGTDIKALEIIRVDESGHRAIQAWIERRRWSKIDSLEVKQLSGYEFLARVQVFTSAE